VIPNIIGPPLHDNFIFAITQERQGK